jgi:hypothetical protein
MMRILVRLAWLLTVLSLFSFRPARARGAGADEVKPAPIEVYEWSIWVGSPAQPSLNAARVYRNAMPGLIGTTRPRVDDKEQAGKFPVAPVSVVQFFGQDCKDIDVDVRTKHGTIVAHWPPGTERSGRIQWFGSSLSTTPPAGIPQGYIPETHWFQKLRAGGSALFLKNESHLERFIAYDADLTIAVPIKIRGGPDEYTLQNLTENRLRDIAVIAPAKDGFRVGWLDELPTAVPEDKLKSEKEKAREKEKEKVKPEPTQEEKEKQANALFQEAEAKKEKPAEEKLPPLPPEASPDMRARVDQVLNRQVMMVVGQAPRREVIDLILRQVRLGYDLDDRTIAKAEIDLNQAVEMKAGGVSARDALADVMGASGLSYRVTDEGKLFITTAARLAEESDKKRKVIEGPPVKLVMAQPIKPSEASYREFTRDTLYRRLTGQGLRDDLARTLLEQYGALLFEPGELIILAHLSREALDDAVLLDVFPPPRKFVRVALLLVHGVDPRLQDQARALVQQLGDASPKTREAAETRLFALGSVAVPALEDALTNQDAEIVFRSERLLLRLNRPVP